VRSLLYIAGIFFVLTCLSCRKKKYPESSVENSPVFFFRATVNKVPVDFYAGLNGYQMFSDYSKDSSDVYNLIGTIKKNDCDSVCPASIEIRINDYMATPANAPVNINMALAPKYYDLQAPLQTIQFESSFNKPGGTYNWDFGDGTTSSLSNPSHTFKKAGRHRVCLTVRDPNQCVSNICNEVKTGTSDKNCMAVISPVIGDSVIAFNSVITGGVGPFQYLWTFGDGQFSNIQSPQHHYKYGGSYPVSLRVIDSKNDTSTAYYNIVTKSDISSCAANFKPKINVNTSAYNPFSNVVITWVDESGTVYRSNGSLQASGNYFQVLSVEDYIDNGNGQPTRKAHVKFKCDVFSGGQKVTIENAEAMITVAYK
jgi:PKD repeat protein